MQNAPATRDYKDVQFWPRGVNSYGDPQLIRDDQVRWAVNAVNRGGLWQTRPGFKKVLEAALDMGSAFYLWWVGAGSPVLHPQFFTIFPVTAGQSWAVFGISGGVFIAEAMSDGTFGPIRILPGLNFNPTAPLIIAQQCVKSADLVNGLKVVRSPRNVLILQDGSSRAGFWDGLSTGHLNPQKLWTVDADGNTLFAAGYNETRIGLHMAWSGNRLWVFDGTQGHASDINDPLHFTEETVLTNVPVFNFPHPVTGAIDRGTSGVQQNMVFVFMGTSTESLRSGIQDRSTWRTTDDFQRTVFKGVGCVAPKSIINHLGLLHWYSADGIVTFDSLGTVVSSQYLPPIDSEMSYSKRRMATDRSGVCAGGIDAYVWWSVPVGPTTNGRVYNAHTQVFDKCVLPPAPGDSGVVQSTIAAWQGIWTGIRPVEWATAQLFGQTRSFALSMDSDGVIRLWEAFQANRADNGQQIPWVVETKTHPVTQTPFDESNFRFCRVLAEQIIGNLRVIGSYKGLRGQYHQLLDITVTSTPGGIFVPNYSAPMLYTTPMVNFAKQFREFVSENSTDPGAGDCQSREVESAFGDNRDRAFSLLLRMQGVGALLAYRIATDKALQDTEGKVMDSETGLRILPEVGCPAAIEGVLPSYTLPDSPAAEAFSPFEPRFTEDEYACPV